MTWWANITNMVPHFQRSIQTITMQITEYTALEFEQKYFTSSGGGKIFIGYICKDMIS